MNIREEIYRTADLLTIAITDEEAEKLIKSFSQLMEYFSILQDISVLDVTLQSDDRVKGVLRDASTTCQYNDSHDLIEKSEEHEDDFFIIPSIL